MTRRDQEWIDESMKKLNDQYTFGEKIIFNEKAPEALQGKEGTFQGVGRDSPIVNVHMDEPVRPNGPDQITLVHGWNGFDIHNQAEGHGIFEKK